MLVRDAGSGEPFYMSPAIACHRCFLSCPFHFPSPACFSDLLTAFSWLLQPSGWAIKRPERIQSSCACPSSLCWLIFCFPSVFSFKESYVLLLCIRLVSLPLLHSLSLLLIVLVLLFFPGLEHDGKGQLSEEGLNTADKAFRRLQGSYSAAFPPWSPRVSTDAGGKEKEAQSSRGNPHRGCGLAMWALGRALLTQSPAYPEPFSRERRCPVPALGTLGHECAVYLDVPHVQEALEKELK